MIDAHRSTPLTDVCALSSYSRHLSHSESLALTPSLEDIHNTSSTWLVHPDSPAAVAGDAPEHSNCSWDAMTSCLRKVANNSFEGNLGRRMANAANVGVRTGLIVGLTTTTRQLIGFAIEKAATLGNLSTAGREASGAAAMALGPGLNLAGFIRDEINQTATAQSRASRIGMLALSGGAIAATSLVGAPSALSSLMSSFGPQVASYCLARDLIQMFLPLHDNAPLNLRGTLAAAGLYSGVQMAVGEGMDAWAPNSGAGYAMSAGAAADATSTASVRDRVNDAIRALQPVLGEDVVRGLLNAGAEISDDLIRPAISRALQVRQLLDSVRTQAIAEGRDPEQAIAALPREATEGLRVGTGIREPSWTDLGNQFLTTSAMRTSAFEAVIGVAMSAATALSSTHLSGADQGHVVNAVVAGMLALIYPPFAYAHDQRPAPDPVSPNVAQQEADVELSSLRQRRPSSDWLP